MSAGERQLVALVSASLVDPDVLVLDEATSSVDALTEVRIGRALDKLAAGRTTIAIAHRLSTAARADRVLVLDHGRLVEDGPHAELVLAGGRLFADVRDRGSRPLPRPNDQLCWSKSKGAGPNTSVTVHVTVLPATSVDEDQGDRVAWADVGDRRSSTVSCRRRCS